MKWMLSRLLILIETLFWMTFWLQTRINLRELWPNWFSSPLNSDYLTPFIYLSDILLISWLMVWIVHIGLSWQTLRGSIIKAGHLMSSASMKSSWMWLGMLVVAAGLSVVINGGSWWSWYGWWRLVEGILLSILTYATWQRPEARRYALRILLAGLLVESFILMGEWLTQGSLGWQWLGEWAFTVYTPGIAKIVFNGQEYVRGYGTFAHPNIAAAALLLGLITTLWWILSKLRVRSTRSVAVLQREIIILLPEILQPRLKRWSGGSGYILAAALGCLVAGLFVTFSRSVWVVGIACFGLLLVWLGRYVPRWLRPRRVLGLVTLLTVAAGVVLGPLVWSRFSSLDGTDRLSVERRVQLNNVAIDLIGEHQWWGVGNNNFVIRVAEFGPLYGIGVWREPVHNLYLLITVEAGVIGMGFWLAAHILVWLRLGLAIQRSRGNAELVLLVVLWLALILLGLTDHYWWTSQPGRLLWWMLMGASLAILKMMERKGEA